MTWWVAAAVAAPPIAFPSAPALSDLGACPVTVTELGFTGDMMVHGMQLKAARQEDGTYDMAGLFDEVRPWMAAADVTAANLETTIAGEDLEYTGYPRFNSPPTFLEQIKGAGVDVLQTANNHCLDRGRNGVDRTLDRVDEHGFAHTGTYRTPEERRTPWAMWTLPDGVRVAYLGYTYGTEAGLAPDPPDWFRVAYIDQLRFAWDIADARAAGADLVVVGVHWGLEYRHKPEPYMVDLAEYIVQVGADVVWGHHPHVLQGADVLTVEDARGPRDAFVMYSLGNFVSNQRDPNKDGGVVVRVAVAHCPITGRTWLADARFTPVWVDDRKADRTLHFRVTPARATPALCGDPEYDDDDCANSVRFHRHAEDILPLGRIDADLGPPALRWQARWTVLPVWGEQDPRVWFSYLAAAT